MAENSPLIIFVPGMKPKPEPDLHHDVLWRCLQEGLRRVDPIVAADVAQTPDSFCRASWTWAFYERYRDIAIDLPGIEALIDAEAPTSEDKKEATSFVTRAKRLMFLLGDSLPFLINSLAGDDMRVTLADVARYVDNKDGIGDRVRADLMGQLLTAHLNKRPVLLIGHSLGSVIGWDTLWSLRHEDKTGAGIDLFMTLGSPLGNHVIQRGLRGFNAPGSARYPDNMRRWVNLVAFGEMTALDRRMRNDFAEMESTGLVDSIEDYDVYNHYRENGRLLVHSEYGYLVNKVTAGIIADWWRSHRQSLPAHRAEI